MGVAHIIDIMADLHAYAGPGHWNDPDMLEVGNGGLSLPRTAPTSASGPSSPRPLMAGNDLEAMTPEVREILTNREVIAVNQDPLGMQGRKVRDDGPREVWVKPLADGSKAVVLFNRGTEETTFPPSGRTSASSPAAKAVCATCGGRPTPGSSPAATSAVVAPHGVVMVKITPQF